MRKLLVSSGTLSSGGAERVLSILSDKFVDFYDDVIYLTWYDVPDFYTINSDVRRICVERECGSKNLIRWALWFRRFIKKENPNVILSFLAGFNVLISFCLLGLRNKLIVAERNDPRYIWNGKLTRIIRKIAYLRADGILEQTENNKAYFHGKLLKKTDVIYNPIIMSEDYLGKALKIPKEKRIVSIVRLTKQKNIEMLLYAFRDFRKTHSDYTLTIYGKGPYRGTIERMVSELGLSEFVYMPGAVKNVWDKVVDAKCFVISSWYEGMPNALMEAMCLGLPCISTKVSGAVDLIQDNTNGMLVDLNDSHSMAMAMCKIVENDTYSEEIAKRAVNIYKELNYDVISNQWIQYLDKIENI